MVNDDYEQDITVYMKNGEIFKFYARNIFDFGFVINPGDGGLIQKNNNEWIVEKTDKIRKMSEDEITAYKIVELETDVSRDIRL